MSTQPQLEPLADRIARVKKRKLFASKPAPPDSRPPQSPPKLEIVAHSCFDQRNGETKPERCECPRISFIEASKLIDAKLADWLLYKRKEKIQENRKSIVLTPEGITDKAKREDAIAGLKDGGRWVRISGYEGYHFAPHEPVQGGLDREIEAVRLGTIRDRKTEVAARRKHRKHAKGASPDSDASVEEIQNSDTGLSARGSGFTGRGKADYAPKNLEIRKGELVVTGLGGDGSPDTRTAKPDARFDSKAATRKAQEKEKLRVEALRKNLKKSFGASEQRKP